MNEDNRVLVDGERRFSPFRDQRGTVAQRPARLRADRAARGQAEMADDNVGAALAPSLCASSALKT